MNETKMKWYTLPHRSEHANALAKKFEVRGIPALIIVSKDGTTITKNGRGEFQVIPKVLLIAGSHNQYRFPNFIEHLCSFIQLASIFKI